MLIFGAIILLIVTLACIFFAIKKRRLDSWLSAAMTTRRAMQDELAHDGVDDGPVLKDIVDAARKDGAI